MEGKSVDLGGRGVIKKKKEKKEKEEDAKSIMRERRYAHISPSARQVVGRDMEYH